MADGDISAPQDTLVWNALAIEEPRVIHVSGDIFAFAYEEHDNQGKVATVEIDGAGNIGAAIIDSLTYEGAAMAYPDIVHVSGNVFAITHQGVDLDGFLRTVTINANGTFTGGVIDTFEFETTNYVYGKLFRVADNVFGITYKCGADGKLATITIADNGQITDASLETRIFDSTSCSDTMPVKVADNVFAIFYNRDSGPARVVTLAIADDGAITAGTLDTKEIDDGVVLTCHACKVGLTTYAYVYGRVDRNVHIASIIISALGAIGATINKFIFDAGTCYSPEAHVMRVSDTIVCASYSDSAYDGRMKTIEIDSEGNITDPVLSTLEFDDTDGADPMLIHISGGVYAVFYRGETGYGTIKTPGIETPVAGRIRYLPLMGIG